MTYERDVRGMWAAPVLDALDVRVDLALVSRLVLISATGRDPLRERVDDEQADLDAEFLFDGIDGGDDLVDHPLRP